MEFHAAQLAFFPSYAISRAGFTAPRGAPVECLGFPFFFATSLVHFLYAMLWQD
jgi:hypothetical protein